MKAAERTPRAARSLLMLVQALEGMSLIVELSNDTVVRGRVESVDDAMKCDTPRAVAPCDKPLKLALPHRSITVADAVCDTVEVRRAVAVAAPALLRGTPCHLAALTRCKLQGVRTQLPSVFIRGRLVRFIHLPAELDPEQAIEQHRRRLVDAELHYARKRAGGAPRGAAAAQHVRIGAGEDARADAARDGLTGAAK